MVSFTVLLLFLLGTPPPTSHNIWFPLKGLPFRFLPRPDADASLAPRRLEVRQPRRQDPGVLRLRGPGHLGLLHLPQRGVGLLRLAPAPQKVGPGGWCGVFFGGQAPWGKSETEGSGKSGDPGPLGSISWNHLSLGTTGSLGPKRLWFQQEARILKKTNEELESWVKLVAACIVLKRKHFCVAGDGMFAYFVD